MKDYLFKFVICVFFNLGVTGCHHSETRQPVPVEVVVAHAQVYPLVISAYGSIVADFSADISSEVAGTIQSINFKDGQFVQKGQLLFQLDNEKDRDNLDSLQAQLELKKSLLKKEYTLFQQHYISEQAWENIESQVKNLDAQVNALKVELSKKAIMAPFDGIVGEHKVNVGNYVEPGKEVVSLIGKDSLKIQYYLPDKFSKEVNVGQEVSIYVPALNLNLAGVVNYVSLNIDQDSHMLSLQASFLGKVENLRPGFYVQIKQIINPWRKVLTLPEEAIQVNLDGKYVYKIIGDHAVKIPI